MRIVTVSREFGSGGREIGKRMADIFGCAYYDKEIIASVAENSGLDLQYAERMLDADSVHSFPFTFRRTISGAGYLQSCKIELLLKQKEVIETIAALGKDCVIVGRNADLILKDYNPLNIFVCADTTAKVKRCMERALENEKLMEKELVHKMRQIDKMRAQTRAILSDSQWGERSAYHLTVNTSERSIKDVALAVAAFADCWFRRT